MGVNITTAGVYFGYKDKVVFKGANYQLEIEDNGNVQAEVNSNDKSTPTRSKVSVYNIEQDKTNQIHKGDHVYYYSGPTDLYGLCSEGTITKIESAGDDGRDRQVTVTWVESEDLSKNTFKANFNGVSTVKTKGKHPKTKLNMTFKSGAKASTIIKKIASASGIKIYHMKLVTNKTYKRGYTVSNEPYKAIVKIVKDFKSQIYQRRGKVVIDDYKTDNPYKEHIYFEIGSGLLSEPSVYDKYGSKQCYILECFDDPRVQAGSSVQINSKTLSGLHRVQSVKHVHEDGQFTMEVVVYE